MLYWEKRIDLILTALLMPTVGYGPATAQEEFEIGGPLAGVELPLWRTQHGEPAGYPGSLPEKMAMATEVEDGQIVYGSWGPQAQSPELELYPGAVEHYRAYMFKYMPIRSFFDRQSQIRNFVAPDLPGADRTHLETYAEPVYWVPRHAPVVNTGQKRKAVPVIRCRPEDPVFRLALGSLGPGLYAVRVIGAVETKHLRPFRKSLVLRMRVNDGIEGEEHTYRLRAGYCDEFYSVAEFYFHAPEKRDYRAEVTLDKLSAVELLVHDVSLDDALAGTVRRPIKKSSVASPAPVDQRSRLTTTDRLARDKQIWRSVPPLNTQASGTLYARAGHHAHFSEHVTFGVGDRDPEEIEARYGRWQRGSGEVLLANNKLHLEYTLQDLLSGKPLPDPYPYRDYGVGLVFPDPNDSGSGRLWSPIAHLADAAYRGPRGGDLGDPDGARDAAVGLIRYAYQFPSIEFGNYLCSVVRQPGVYGRDLSCRRRGTAAMFLDHYANYGQLAERYDRVFPFIEGNEDLARSIQRFVPWVETPDDLVMLCDVFLLQTLAKRILRYHYHTDPLVIARCATILGDRAITDDWMEFLFSRTFIYPLPPSGIQDAMITGCERDGCEYVASTFYAQEEGASRVAAGLRDSIRHGGDPRYDLSDSARYPKPEAHLEWQRNIVVAGCDFLRIGDVTGPDKAPGQFGKHGTQLRSRVMPYWAAVLEGGHESSDRSFKHAVYLRMGFGFGHHHHDTMDLQVVAHGQPMTIDGGQRPGYSSPGDRSTRVHNLVQVDGDKNWGHSWVKALVDSAGARYMQAEMVPPGGSNLYRRQVALIDVYGRDGKPGPDGYVFDVVRVAGGNEHVYCFHGLVNDEFKWNVTEEKAVRDDPFLEMFRRAADKKKSGKPPETYQATWRQIRRRIGRGFGSEESWGRASGPRKFTRLHLFDVKGDTAYVADAVCHKWGYQYTCSMVRRQGTDLESVFPALIQPYLGEPFIVSSKLLEIPANEGDALRAVAVEVATRSGQTDICYADGRPQKVRRAGPLRVGGEFAYYSTDADGLRLASIAGGTLLETPEVSLLVRVRERTGKVVKVDYHRRRLWLEEAWSAPPAGGVFEIGVPGRTTTYTASRLLREGSGTVIHVTQGADYFRSRVTAVHPDTRTVTCAMGIALGLKPGIDRNWVASNEEATHFWRADYLDHGKFLLKDAPVTEAAFEGARALRLWEYGVGDTARQSTYASLRRLEAGLFELAANIDVDVSLRASAIEASIDRSNWSPLPIERQADRVSVAISVEALSPEGRLYLRIRAR